MFKSLYPYQDKYLEGVYLWYIYDTIVGMMCLDCSKKIISRGYCDTHYRQHKKLGNLPPSTQARRMAIVGKDYSTIPIGIGGKHGDAIVDNTLAKKLDKYLWTISRGYALRNSRENKHIFMHHSIIGKPSNGLVVDHINGNKLDNRACNLRFITQQQNTFNQSLSKKNSSGYTGVVFRKDRNKWTARIGLNGKQIFLGNFDDKQDAIRARTKAKSEYHAI